MNLETREQLAIMLMKEIGSYNGAKEMFDEMLEKVKEHLQQHGRAMPAELNSDFLFDEGYTPTISFLATNYTEEELKKLTMIFSTPIMKKWSNNSKEYNRVVSKSAERIFVKAMCMVEPSLKMFFGDPDAIDPNA